LHRLSSAFILGFHGCDKSIGNALLAGNEFKKSENVYDWLGGGIYFWESNPRRGYEWAVERSREARSRIKDPFVVGAVIDLGYCLDLTTSDAATKIKTAYDSLVATKNKAGNRVPENKGLRPELDCEVINWLHYIHKEAGEEPFQSVRGVFIEGEPIYPTANFKEKTHIQIAVREPKCIKGVFRVKPELLTLP
jgi:hypothetical protein